MEVRDWEVGGTRSNWKRNKGRGPEQGRKEIGIKNKEQKEKLEAKLL